MGSMGFLTKALASGLLTKALLYPIQGQMLGGWHIRGAFCEPAILFIMDIIPVDNKRTGEATRSTFQPDCLQELRMEHPSGWRGPDPPSFY